MKNCFCSCQGRKTREVKVGKVGVGGSNPIRLQSMTNTKTTDVEGTVEQVKKIVDAGGEIVRFTVQGMQEVAACEKIKNLLEQKNIDVPTVADIHFFPKAALYVADFVDKVRINPGNYGDKRASFQETVVDEKVYMEKIEEKLVPLLDKCKKLKRAIRIGVNHGSLSDRIMTRFGNTPRGMVESAVEFTHIFRKHDFHDIVYSMKSSNPEVMIAAYRLLVDEMKGLQWDYPLHLGVTEAGEGEDGRVKSAMGIGALLLDGIGDTIRVSLTEDPWKEIDPCKRLVAFTTEHCKRQKDPLIVKEKKKICIVTKKDANYQSGAVFLPFAKEEACVDFFKESQSKKMSIEGLVVEEDQTLSLDQYIHYVNGIAYLNEGDDFDCLLDKKIDVVWLTARSNPLTFARKFFAWKEKHSIKAFVVLHFIYDCSEQDLVIRASAEYGALFCEGNNFGICLDAPYSLASLQKLSFQILQAARKRLFKADFISCPGCGRTLFDIQKVSQKIRNRFSHLVGTKIAVMGCIVNGPGEMADADFGYVGSGLGKIDLYVGKKCVKKGVDEEKAADELENILKEQGCWKEAQKNCLV